MDRHKVELLRRTFRAGPSPLAWEVGALLKDKLWGATHLVFELRRRDPRSVSVVTNDYPALCSYTAWDVVPDETRAAITRHLHGHYWGKPQWMELGWRMWIGTVEGELAIISWTRGAGQCEDFFFPMSAGCALIWQTVTVPAFRGRGLCPVVLRRLIDALIEDGFDRVYCSCRDYNISSRRAIEKAGFRYVGQGFVRKRTGRGTWHPVVRPFVQG